jgi:hypothetical protein
MEQELKQALSHVLWIGGATDAGKTTVARLLAERHRLQLYIYDRRDLPHHERLAQRSAHYDAFLKASMDERWVHPEPEELVQRSLRSFRDRFPLVVEDLLALPRERTILAEGFGLTPEIIHPILSNHRQAIWLVPTEAFKRASMRRRGKFRHQPNLSDPERAIDNLFKRDMLLAARVVEQARLRNLTVHEIDGSRSAEEMATLIEQHVTAESLPVYCSHLPDPKHLPRAGNNTSKCKIIGFHRDEIGDWVADLECGHTQHVRHNPPLTNRPWVLTEEGRRRFLGHRLECKDCDRQAQSQA